MGRRSLDSSGFYSLLTSSSAYSTSFLVLPVLHHEQFALGRLIYGDRYLSYYSSTTEDDSCHSLATKD